MNRLRFAICILIFFQVLTTGKCESKFSMPGEISSDTTDYSKSVHMYVCIEALQFLKETFPEMDFSVFSMKIGSQDDVGTRPWQMGKISTGAAREDIEDPVFDIRGPFGLEASCSHFWLADDRTNGDHSLTYLQLIGNYPNAFTKVQKYFSGDWHAWDGSQYAEREFINYSPGDGHIYRFSYHTVGLIQFYKTRRIWHESTINYLGQTILVRQEITVSNQLRDIIVWEVIGRILHLIADISVPAHNHNDVHLPLPIINDFDCYHGYIDEGGYQNFNWMTAMNSGGFINPYLTNEDPVRYLMYTTSQLADHFPSGPDCDEIPQQHLGNNNLPGGTNDMIESYYSELGPAPANIPDLYLEGSYCFNHAIRACAAMLYYFGVETGILETDPNAIPVINSFSINLPDTRIFHGETMKINCQASGANLNYDWFVKVCSKDNLCTMPLQGLSFVESGNVYKITNSTFQNRWTCNFYDSICGSGILLAPPPLNFFVGVKVSNQLGSTMKYFSLNGSERFYPNQNLRPVNPPVSGCPFALVKNAEGYSYENDILPESEFIENRGREIEDKLILVNEPIPDSSDGTIEIAINETGVDRSFINRVRLFEVYHPQNSEIGITKHKDIVMYYPDQINMPSAAMKSGKDVTKILFYDTLFGNSVKGKKGETLITGFRNLNTGNHDLQPDSNAVIADIETENPEFIIPVVKDIAGNIGITDSSGSYCIQNFSKRIFRSDVIMPFAYGKTITGLSLNWNSDFNLSYIFTTGIFYKGFVKNELELTGAESSIRGNVLNDLLVKDSLYSEVDTSCYIELKFKPRPYPNLKKLKRRYVLCIDGRYEKMDHGFYENENPQQVNKLVSTSFSAPAELQVYPNPFNSETVLQYSLNASGNIILKVYDVLGREVKTLVNEFQDAGKKSIRFNAADLAGGIYFFRLTTGDFTSVRKFVLLK